MKNRIKFDIKEMSQHGSFEGLLSPYGNVDGGGDVVEPGAYAKNLKERGNQRVILWQHKTDVPIGQMTLEDRQDGLYCKGQLLMDLPEAQKAYSLIKAGIIKGLSIGYEAIKKEIKNGVRQLKEIKLFEGSIVTFPMNDMALISSVKRKPATKDDFNEELSDIQLQDGGYQMFCALRSALCQIPGSDMTRDAMISTAETVLQQFSDAYMAYLPMFLDMIAEDGYCGPCYMGLDKLEIKAAPTKRVDGADLTSDCFAYVGDKNDPSTWKLPIKFPGDAGKTESHIRNALAQFGQTQGIPESERASVLAKIHAAASAHGIDVAKAAESNETKEGRMISSANMEKLKAACGYMKSAHEIVTALMDAPAGSLPLDGAGGDTTDEPKAAAQATQEPDELHSMVETFSQKLKAALAA